MCQHYYRNYGCSSTAGIILKIASGIIFLGLYCKSFEIFQIKTVRWHFPSGGRRDHLSCLMSKDVTSGRLRGARTTCQLIAVAHDVAVVMPWQCPDKARIMPGQCGANITTQSCFFDARYFFCSVLVPPMLSDTSVGASLGPWLQERFYFDHT